MRPEKDTAATGSLARALAAQEERLMACVHCGFCLPACPTYVRLGDEADSPRGRLYLMEAVVEGRLDPGSGAFQTHIDRCLGCRACETVCPSGVEYGFLLERAREAAAGAQRPPLVVRTILGVFKREPLLGLGLVLGRLARDTGVAGLLARLVPPLGPLREVKFGLRMLASTRAPSFPGGSAPASGSGPREGRVAGPAERASEVRGSAAPSPSSDSRVALLRGCVQKGLYGRVNDATARVLEANGYVVVSPGGQGCCGALHAHAGSLDDARALARRNVDAFEAAAVDRVAVNAAGCGAAMREYGHLLADDPDYAERAARLSESVRDVSELLAQRGPRPGGELAMRVTYDAPCHLLHGQRVEHAPGAVLDAIPGLEVVPLENADECCGGAGIYGLTHPELGGQIGSDKVRRIRETGADAVATGNPGCMMQIGAGLASAGASVQVLHPVELLDESYRRGGVYGDGA